jgi:hypothetical protein
VKTCCCPTSVSTDWRRPGNIGAWSSADSAN